VAGDGNGVETKGLDRDQAQLVGKLIDRVGIGADQTMFAGNEREQGGEFEIAEAVNLFEEFLVVIIRHRRCR